MSAMTEVVTTPHPDGCALCGLPEDGHDQRYGMAHLGTGRPTSYVRPSPDLLARRKARRVVDCREIAEFHPVTGEVTTHFVRVTCACGAGLVATPERAATARCEACTRAKVERA